MMAKGATMGTSKDHRLELIGRLETDKHSWGTLARDMLVYHQDANDLLDLRLNNEELDRLLFDMGVPRPVIPTLAVAAYSERPSRPLPTSEESETADQTSEPPGPEPRMRRLILAVMRTMHR